MDIVIHHNPDCGTSRNVLAIIKAAGYDPYIIDYLKTGWTKPQLKALFAAAGITARQALRLTKSPAVELGLDAPSVSDEILIELSRKINITIVKVPEKTKTFFQIDFYQFIFDRYKNEVDWMAFMPAQ